MLKSSFHSHHTPKCFFKFLSLSIFKYLTNHSKNASITHFLPPINESPMCMDISRFYLPALSCWKKMHRSVWLWVKPRFIMSMPQYFLKNIVLHQHFCTYFSPTGLCRVAALHASHIPVQPSHPESLYTSFLLDLHSEMPLQHGITPVSICILQAHFVQCLH